MSAQKALQGSDTETRELLGGTTENSVSPDKGSLICPPDKSMIFYKKETDKKIELVARPVGDSRGGQHLDVGGEADARPGLVLYIGDGLEVGLGLVQVAHTHLGNMTI